MNEAKTLECSIDCIKPYSDAIEGITVLFNCCAIVFMVICIEWSFRNKEFLSHYFEYSIVFTIGAIIATISLFSWPLHESNISCNIKPLFAALGGGIMFGIFVARVRKIWVNFVWLRRQSLVKMRQIISSKRMEQEPKLILGGIIVLELFLLLLFYSIPSFRPTCVCQQYDNQEKMYSSCSFNASFGTLVLCANLVPLAITAFYGYEILKEFRTNSELTEYQYRLAHTRKKNNSLNTIASVGTVRTRSSRATFNSVFKSYSARNTRNETPLVGEILGVRQDEVDEFKPIFISVSAISFLALLAALISVLSSGFEQDSSKRTTFFIGRTVLMLCMTCIPVIIIYARAYSMVTLKQYKLRSDEEKDDIENLIKNKGRRTMSERVVRAVASFRGTLPGDSPSPWKSSKNRTESTAFTGGTSGTSTNSFFVQFKSNIREKLTTDQPKQTTVQENESTESVKLAKS